MTKGQKKGEPAPFLVVDMYEKEIMGYLCQGLKHYQIANKMPPLTSDLICRYVMQIRKRHGAKNTPHLIHIYHEKKLF